ncbi:signal recognition particle-docking protein FtsY [Oryzomonas japonica]|uniref:Signal recognition particle receptor FtsY n=1 Tax=Oryzomonas japonica TaxID=2603858 RepID=A0A7J4ZUX9_9BACT|nr:signal recognition particle-docking protein FtsY [Oryzomonas japonica]KAB0667320.1 signal recognition particle-docking protein FtsY [Oryzomonas japonica]
MEQQEKKGFFRGLVDKIAGAGQPQTNDIEPSPTAGEPPATPSAGAEERPDSGPGFFSRLKNGLKKTKDGLVGRIDALVLGKKEIDADTLEELEEILITSDIGVKTTVELIRSLEQRLGRNELKDGAALRAALKADILARLNAHHSVLDTDTRHPFVLLVIGVNGVGKTTTIGKLASRFTGNGKRVLLAAADTFRAAAAEQLEAWGERSGVDVVRHKEGADPSAVVFDACKAAVARQVDILIVDTAGRLHTKVNLMEEMKKIHRVIGREIPGAPHETLLVLDAATGQNAVSQARLFKEAAGVTGIALTKLDGTAKGGIVVAVSHEFGLPVRYIGVGEAIDDLRDFNPQEFTDALFQA